MCGFFAHPSRIRLFPGVASAVPADLPPSLRPTWVYDALMGWGAFPLKIPSQEGCPKGPLLFSSPSQRRETSPLPRHASRVTRHVFHPSLVTSFPPINPKSPITNLPFPRKSPCPHPPPTVKLPESGWTMGRVRASLQGSDQHDARCRGGEMAASHTHRNRPCAKVPACGLRHITLPPPAYMPHVFSQISLESGSLQRHISRTGVDICEA